MKMYTMELASLLEQQGHYQKALEQYRLLLQDEPGNQQLLDAVARLEYTMEVGCNEDQQKSVMALFQEWLSLLILKSKVMDCKRLTKG